MSESEEIYTINKWNKTFFLKAAHGVNSYLIRTDSGFIMIDTGVHSKTKEFEMVLENSGCQPGDLNLIIITHGDLDHIGHCTLLQKKYKAKIAIHRGELESVISTNMTLNRKKEPAFITKLLLSFLGLLYKANRFQPDILINDGDDLSVYGLDAVVLHLPGHSKGSIGILTATGNLFCGDLLLNIDNPSKADLLDDLVDLENSIEKLQNLTFHTIYPGHGEHFSKEQFLELIYKK